MSQRSKCSKTGYPQFNTGRAAFKAGNKLIRHPENTMVVIDHCDYCACYHFLVQDKKD